MADEDEQDGADAAEAFEAMRGELALLRRAVEGLAAERGAIDVPDYSETLGRMQQGVDGTTGRLDHISKMLAAAPVMAMTPEQMAQRISAAGSTARREDQAALAKAGEDKARVMAELRAIAGSAWTRADQKNRQLWFGLGGVAAGILVWAIVPGLVAREIAPASWQWPERIAARTLGGTTWEGAYRLARASHPGTWNAMVTGAVIGQGNEAALERCQRAANKAGEPVRCTVRIRREEAR